MPLPLVLLSLPFLFLRVLSLEDRCSWSVVPIGFWGSFSWPAFAGAFSLTGAGALFALLLVASGGVPPALVSPLDSAVLNVVVGALAPGALQHRLGPPP